MVTVLTPTYNRAYLLGRLYKSLQNQEDKRFEWLIIDDGSVDATELMVKGWQNEGAFPIRYIKKENGGKHTALNIGIGLIESEITFIVDSDDWLSKDAIKVINSCHSKYGSEKLCGYSFFRKNPDGKYQHKGRLSEEGLIGSFVECRINHNLSGDMAEAWYTSCLKEFPFPEYAGENFLGEDVVWIKMAGKYKMRFFSNSIYFSEYLEDGLTKTRRKRNIESPKGCVARAKAFLGSDVILKYKLKAMLQYQIYGRFAEYDLKMLYEGTVHKLLFLCCVVPSIFVYLSWSRKYRNIEAYELKRAYKQASR